jgi:hypothetical protein
MEILIHLQETDFREDFSFDLSTSPNHCAIFDVVGHWISATGDLVSVLLGMECFHGPHSDANQAEIIWKLFEQYGLGHNVDYFTTDNATNNDAAMYKVAKLFSNLHIALDPVSAHTSWFGHIISPMVKSFLCGQNTDAVVQELRALHNDVD